MAFFAQTVDERGSPLIHRPAVACLSVMHSRRWDSVAGASTKTATSRATKRYEPIPIIPPPIIPAIIAGMPSWTNPVTSCA
jgi:hypothetical protein